MTAVPEHSPGCGMTLPRILLVDDDPVLLQALPDTLGLRILEVMIEGCLSGLQALEQLQISDYDAVISDIKMPNLDRLALLGRSSRDA